MTEQTTETDDERQAWLEVSEAVHAKIWGKSADDVFNALLGRCARSTPRPLAPQIGRFDSTTSST
jgi:hypothetical protein